MSKKRILIIPILILVIVGIVLGVQSLYADNQKNSLELNMYFFNNDYSSITAENQKIKCDENDDIAELVVKNLIKGTSNSKLTRIMDKGTKLLDMTKINQQTVVDFSSEFLTNDPTKDTLAVYAVTKTLCQLPGISEVKVTVEGKDIIGADGNVLGFLSGDDINVESDENKDEAKYIALYFTDSESGKLVKEIRTVTITDTQPIEQYIVNELIKGPISKNHLSVLSPDTTVISVQTTDGTCFVNFASNFVSKNSGTNEKENAAIYSIVNSITELDTVKSVQFLVDGKKISDFGTNDLSGTFYRNSEMIE